MNEKIKLYIVDIEEQTVDRLEEVFYTHPHLGVKVIGYAHNYISCINDIDRVKSADIVLISAYLPDQMGVDLIPKIKKINPNVVVTMMVTKQTLNLEEASKANGADGVIQKPFQVGVLMEEIESHIDPERLKEARNVTDFTGEKKKKSFEIRNDQPSEEGTKETTKKTLFETYTDPTLISPYEDEEGSGENPKVVCVFYGTSSTGKTTMLVNAAATIYEKSEFKPKICIIDFNLVFPSVLNKFHGDELIRCRKSIYDLVEDINSLDENLINQALITHEPTGIKIINTPADVIRNFDRISPEHVEQLLIQLKEMFDLILIDVPSKITEDTTTFSIVESDKVVVLAEPDITNLLNTRKFIKMMQLYETHTNDRILNKFNYVLNKSNNKTGISTEDVKKAFYNNKIKVEIPEDVNITFLSNNGRFVKDENVTSRKSIEELARIIYPMSENFSLSTGEKKKNSLFGSLFKKK